MKNWRRIFPTPATRFFRNAFFCYLTTAEALSCQVINTYFMATFPSPYSNALQAGEPRPGIFGATECTRTFNRFTCEKMVSMVMPSGIKNFSSATDSCFRRICAYWNCLADGFFNTGLGRSFFRQEFQEVSGYLRMTSILAMPRQSCSRPCRDVCVQRSSQLPDIVKMRLMVPGLCAPRDSGR